MTTIDCSAPVLVTGANGYIASWLVKYLLEQGFTVHGSVRDSRNTDKVGHLLKLGEAHPGQLQLFDADLLREGSFDAAMAGCQVVFHTASPFIVRGIKDPQAQLVEPALSGTRNVLQAANRCDSVKRVVLTTSVAAVYGDFADIELIDGHAFNEGHWNTSSSLSHQPYNYSKTVAEKEAWDICAQQSRWDLVAINPGLVLGPSLARASDSTSLSTMLELVDGTLRMGVPKLRMPLVDVRDVAHAHILAATNPEAEGRHLLVGDTASLLELAGMIEAEHGDRYPTPQRELPKLLTWLLGPLAGISRKMVARNVGYAVAFDCSKAIEELGMQFRPLPETVRDHLQQMVADGLV